MSLDILIGYLRSGYAEERNFLYLREHGVDWIDCGDRLHVLHKIWHRLSGKGYSGLLHSIAWPGGGGYDLVHGFNAIQLGRHPWVVTYETSLPRQGGLPEWMVAWTWRQLAKERCRAILALSGCSAERLRNDLETNKPGVSASVIDAVKRKLQVLHPPQPVLLDESGKEALGMFATDRPLRLAMVGHDFYRKGGLEILMAMDALVGEGRDLVLSIAGKMAAGDYASRAGEREVALAEGIMSRLGNRVERLGSIPPERVQTLLRESHVLCLPTWGETYGYSVLEGQASSCAAVTTDIRALPEINDDTCGWVIPVPKLKGGDADIDSPRKRDEFRKLLVDGLVKALREAHDDRVLLRRKAMASVERIRRGHDPDAHARQLLKIYRES